MGKETALKIKNLAREIGYTACGITNAEPFKEFESAIKERIDRFPEAAHLYAPMKKRIDPRLSTPWAKSIVVCARWYGKYKIPKGLTGYIGRNYLCDRRNILSDDYDMPKKMKKGLIQMGLKIRGGGVPDRWAGARAGITRFGKNCFAYSQHGSWINIETWLIDKELPADKPTPETACPENCRKCIDACPTKALVEPFVMRMDRCIAYLTYESPPPIQPELWKKMEKWIYGCDICQKVCPLNHNTWKPLKKISWLEEAASFLKPEALANMDEETYRSVVHPAFWYIPIKNIDRWHKNAKRALQSS